MVRRSAVVTVHNRFTSLRLEVLTVTFLGLIIGSWQIDGQLQAPEPSARQEETRGSAYLNLMENSVRQLASSLVDVYSSNCGDLVSCDECSLDGCRPLLQNGNLTCTNLSQNIKCNEHYQGCRSSITMSMEQSSTTYPRKSLGAEPDSSQTRTICGTTRLDATFKELFHQNPYHADYFVGFPDGSRRIFPGREQADPKLLRSCTDYDCRLRPWYCAAISHKNHLVILVDSRDDPLDPSYFEQSDTLNFSKVFAKGLLETVCNGDRVNVVPFSSAAKANALVAESIKVNFNTSDPQSHQELGPLKGELDNIRPAPDNVRVTSSNLTAALQEALRLFKSVGGMMTQSIVVFTNGDISPDVGLNMTLDQVYGSLIRLFVYSMKNTDDKLHILDSVAKRAHGAHVRLATSDNPMFQLRSYFGYMARMQVRSNRAIPFWTPSYRNYYEVGDTISVVAPGPSDA